MVPNIHIVANHSITPVPDDPTSSSYLCSYMTCGQNTHMHKIIMNVEEEGDEEEEEGREEEAEEEEEKEEEKNCSSSLFAVKTRTH